MRYIIVNSVKDGNRYLRKVNKHTQNTTYNVKCIHLSDLAKEVVIKDMAQRGEIKALDILNSMSGVDVLLEMLKSSANDEYFIPVESISLATCEEVLHIMQQIRMGHPTLSYEQPEMDSVIQLKELIKSYEECISKMDMYDIPLLYKKAISILKERDTNKSDKDSYEITDVCEEKLTALEKDFLVLYTKGDYKCNHIGQELEKNHEESLIGAKFFKAYGISNEINYVISQIIENGYKLGDVEILYSSADYEPYIEANFGARSIPYSMINRKLPADNEYLNIIKLILKWVSGGYVYEDLKPIMVLSNKYRKTYFKQINAGIGWGKERYKAYIQNEYAKEIPADEEDKHKKIIDFCECLQELIQIFDKEDGEAVSYDIVCERLLRASINILGKREEYKYVVGAIKSIYTISKNFDEEQDINEIVNIIYEGIKEISYDDAEDTSTVCIRKIDNNVHILERKHIYVLGMSNTHYSCNMIDSPVLSDECLVKYIDCEKGYVSLRKEEEEVKRKALYATIASRDKEGTLTIGYCCYDTVNLRGLAPSVPFVRMAKGAEVAYAGYENIVSTKMIYTESDIWKEVDEIEEKEELEIKETEKEGIETEKIEADDKANETENGEDSIIESPISSWSASSLQMLLGCPRQFYYSRILSLPDENYKLPKADGWLPASEKGTLAHGVMEDYCREIFLEKDASEIPTMVDEEKLKEIMDKRVEEMLTVCPYISDTAYIIERDTIKNNCKTYLDRMHKEFSGSTNKWKVFACEASFSDINIEFRNNDNDIAKLLFRGCIDRIDYFVDEEGLIHYRIIDYKSGSRKSNEEEISLHRHIQHVVYKLALDKMMQNDFVVDEVRFVHFFDEDIQNQEIIWTGDSIKDFPVDVHEFVIRVLKEQVYKKCSVSDGLTDEDNRSCQYCTYKDICVERIGEKL